LYKERTTFLSRIRIQEGMYKERTTFSLIDKNPRVNDRRIPMFDHYLVQNGSIIKERTVLIRIEERESEMI